MAKLEVVIEIDPVGLRSYLGDVKPNPMKKNVICSAIVNTPSLCLCLCNQIEGSRFISPHEIDNNLMHNMSTPHEIYTDISRIYISMQINKYDRQIRLWGVDGQRRLGEARVGLVSCSGAGVETLKNLVLPGVGHIQIWDHRKVEVKDLATCFFYAPQDVGRYRAEAALANLLQMNPDVQGKCHIGSPLSLFQQQNKAILSSYSLLIVGGELPLQSLTQISKKCWAISLPVIFITVLGFYIYVRNQKEIHTVQFQRTAAKKYYLRLDDPFEGLWEYSRQWDIEKMVERVRELKEKEEEEWKAKEESRKKEGKAEVLAEGEVRQESSLERSALLRKLSAIPYPVILMQLYHGAPKQARSKTHILQKLKTYSMIVGQGYRDNFTQASSRYFDLLQNPQNFLRDLDRFNSPHIQAASSSSEPALVFLRGVKQLLQKRRYLPQPTDLPDMQTETKLYISLKQTYKKQHELDLDELSSLIASFCGGEGLKRKELSNFVNNLEAINVETYSAYWQELQSEEQRDQLKWSDLQGKWRNVLLCFRAYLEYQQQVGRIPTMQDEPQLYELVDKIKTSYGFDSMQEGGDPLCSSVDQRYLKEMLRVEGQTTMSVVSIAGAIAGQEAIKLITHCFTPVKNGFIFNGVEGRGSATFLL